MPEADTPGPANDQSEKSSKKVSALDSKGKTSPGDVMTASGSEGRSDKGAVKSAQYAAQVNANGTSDKTIAIQPGLPSDWPDPRGFIPPPPSRTPPPLIPSNAPVLRHVRTYNGNDMGFTTALSSYFYFRDDARSGGWQSYLNRSDDFIRFCCHMHISEMLTARGGAGESRVVLRRYNIR
jgi:hypothetical protein